MKKDRRTEAVYNGSMSGSTKPEKSNNLDSMMQQAREALEKLQNKDYICLACGRRKLRVVPTETAPNRSLPGKCSNCQEEYRGELQTDGDGALQLVWSRVKSK